MDIASSCLPVQSINVGQARLLDKLPGLVAYFDPDLRYRFANATYARWRGLDPAAIIGRHCREIVGDINYPTIAAKLHEVFENREVTYEYDLFDGGFSRRVQGTYVPDVDAGGRVVGAIVLVTDISQRTDLLERIAETEAMFEQAFENAPIGMAVVDTGGRLVRSNAALAAILARPVGALAGLDFRDVTHPEDLDADNELFEEVLAGKRNGYRLHKRYLRPDAGIVEAHLTVTATRNAAGQVMRFVAQVEDVTLQQAAERRLRQDAARLGLAVEAVRGGFWHLDIATNVFETSAKLACYIDGAGAEPLGLQTYVARMAEADLASADISPLTEGRLDQCSAEYRLHTVAGLRWMRCDRRLVRGRDGRPEQVVGVVTDITEEREQQLLSQEEAETDPLTGILNRRGLDRRLPRLDRSSACGVLAIDLDRFKAVNDRHGHKAGDAVLVECARRLRREVRDSDLLARLGGDEFLIVMPRVGEHMLAALSARVSAALSAPMSHEGVPLAVGGSVGAAWSAQYPHAIDELIGAADRALYAVKASERGRWRMAG